MAALFKSHEMLHEFQVCRRITTHYAKSLSIAARLLPLEKQMGIYANYALYRRLTNAVREAGPRQAEAARRSVGRMRNEVGWVYTEKPIVDPSLRALRVTVRRFGIPEQLFLDMFRATELDLEKSRYRTFEEFRENQNTQALSEIIVRVLGVSSVRAIARAQDLGLALRLTSVLRNISVDFSHGRILIPMEDMLQCGYTEEALRNHVVDERFRRLLAQQVERTRELYASGLGAIGALDDDGSRDFVRVLSHIRSALLYGIESGEYDVFHGPRRVPLVRMIRMALKGMSDRHDAVWTPDPLPSPTPSTPEASRPQQSSVSTHNS